MRPYLILSMYLGLLASCGSTKSFVYGEFEGTDGAGYELNFQEKTFSLVNTHKPFDLSVYPCCGDSIAFGSWKLDNDGRLLRLTSSTEVNIYLLDIQVVEEKVSGDSLQFEIMNPIELIGMRSGNRQRELELRYYLSIRTNNSKLDQLGSVSFDSRIIKIRRPLFTEIQSIRLAIHPVDFVYGPIHVTSLETDEYSVKDVHANRFRINIPQLTHNLISVRRLDSDFVKIVNSDLLEWDGRFFRRKK